MLDKAIEGLCGDTKIDVRGEEEWDNLECISQRKDNPKACEKETQGRGKERSHFPSQYCTPATRQHGAACFEKRAHRIATRSLTKHRGTKRHITSESEASEYNTVQFRVGTQLGSARMQVMYTRTRLKGPLIRRPHILAGNVCRSMAAEGQEEQSLRRKGRRERSSWA